VDLTAFVINAAAERARGAHRDVGVETECRGTRAVCAGAVESAVADTGAQAVDGIARAADALR
jgi:hypothetical protein